MDENTLRIADEPEEDNIEDADPAEVERVLKTLGYLLEVIDSDSIRAILDDACCQIADLVESVDEEEAEAA